MTTNSNTSPEPEPEGTDQPTDDAGLDDNCGSAQIAFTTLTDLGASLAGLRDLAERKDLLGIGIGDSDIEGVERVIINLVEQLGVGVKLAEVSHLHNLRTEDKPQQQLSDYVYLEEVLDPSFPAPLVDCPKPVRSKAEGATRNGSDKRG